jgi:uncharacterized protein (DUF1684 family)
LAVIFSQSGRSSDEYKLELEKFREEKHDFFKNSAGSPFVEKNIPYTPVTFFPANQEFKVRGKLERFTSRKMVTITNSDGSESKYLKFAYAKFTLLNTECSLLILKALGFSNQYLTAFIDETSAITTYGGGRYLDIEIGKSDQVELDFNKAYNPYCAYSGDYLCPLPPRENFIKVAIEAGEKDYKTE